MAEPYTIHIYVVDGDPEGVKIIVRQNWTGWGIAFPRSSWPAIKERSEFGGPGVYILSGAEEGIEDNLPTIYIGQGDEVGTRIDAHYQNKDFWDWGYVFISKGTALNRAHTTWLEYALIDRAHKFAQCRLDNGIRPGEPNLSEWERADTEGFLGEMLRILPLLGIRIFEKSRPVFVTKKDVDQPDPLSTGVDERDTIVVPAQEEGFKDVFIEKNCWYAIRISGGMLHKIRYIAAYQTAPVSAITHYAPVERIELWGDSSKYRVVFAEPAKEISHIPLGNAAPGSFQGPRYTSLEKLLNSESVAELLAKK